MTTEIFIPDSTIAASELLSTLPIDLRIMPTAEFLRAWCAIAYLYPGLHPDGHDEPDSGWPARLLPMAVEAWNRFEAAQLSEEELYPSDAQWCGLYDSMATHTEEEVERRAVFARKETV